VTTAAGGGSDLDVKTATGTRLLKEFPTPDSSISDLTPDGSKLYFFADLDTGQQLWVTNGTGAGTRLVKQTNPSEVFGDLTVIGNEPYFDSTVTHGSRARTLLFKSNGTAAGTIEVALPTGATNPGAGPVTLVNYGEVLYFDDADQLMKTNGTTTTVVGTLAGTIHNLTDALGVLYFTTPDASK
jgi:ELWxxDGT repeat protein